MVNSKYINKLEKNYPLLTQDSFENKITVQEGDIVNIVDKNNKFLAKAYLGKQNKGVGWILTRDKNKDINKEFFKDKLDKAFLQRESFFNNMSTTAFRVFNGEGDGIGGITIDYYNGYYLVTWYSQGAFCFSEYIYNYLESAPNYLGLYGKKRFDANGQYVEGEDFVRGERASSPIIVKENNVNFAVYLDDGAMVGVFIDQRDVRCTLRDKYSGGREVLNTFSYTGAFSVFAALGGAIKTTSVDLANRSLNKTREQFSVNILDPDKHEIIVMDVFEYFKMAKRQNKTFDLVILDPPSFAKSKKHTFSAQKNYTDLLVDAISITRDNGLIIASTNCSQFNMNVFKSFIDKAFKLTGKKYSIKETFSLPKDFSHNKDYPEGNYLKVCFISIDE